MGVNERSMGSILEEREAHTKEVFKIRLNYRERNITYLLCQQLQKIVFEEVVIIFFHQQEPGYECA
jgi:hypothetical protein